MTTAPASQFADEEWPDDVTGPTLVYPRDDADDELERHLDFERRVSEEVQRRRVREEAARRLTAEAAAATAALEPEGVILTKFLAIQDDPATYRIEGLWPVGGRVLFCAQGKAGKSTARDNAVRALVDGYEFLGKFKTTAPERRVIIIDNELDDRTLRRWLTDQGIKNTDHVAVLPLRGRVGTFNLPDPECRARWAKKLRDLDAGIVIFDCLRPVLDALGLDENHDAGRFLVPFDALLAEAGASEAMVVHHMGHAGERARGDSRILDWPDAIWKLVKEDPEDPNSDRFFSAYGRDVDQPQGLLSYEPTTRWLTITGGTRKETAAAKIVAAVVAAVVKEPGIGAAELRAALSPTRDSDVDLAVKEARRTGHITVRIGPKNKHCHYPAGVNDLS